MNERLNSFKDLQVDIHDHQKTVDNQEANARHPITNPPGAPEKWYI